MGVDGQRNAPAALSLENRYPIYRKLVGPQGRSGQVRKISSPPGFDPRTVNPVASRYTDWTVAAHYIISYKVHYAVSGKMQSFVTIQQVVHILTKEF